MISRLHSSIGSIDYSPHPAESFSRNQLIAILAVTLAGLFVRIFQLGDESLWFDETLSLLFASQPLDLSLSSMMEEGLQHSPLYYILLRPFVSVENLEENARVLSVLFGVLAIPLIAVLGRSLHSPQVGVMAAGLLALNPFHVWYSREARMYSLLAVVSIGSSLFFIRNVFERSRLINWIALAAFIAVGINTHHFAYFIPLVQFVFLLSTFRRTYPLIKPWAGAQFVAASTLFPWLSLVLGRGALYGSAGTSSTPESTELILTLWNFTIGYSRQMTIPIALFMVLVLVLVGVGLSSFNYRKMYLVIWLLLPPFVTLLISLRVPMYMDRYMIVSLPSLLILIPAGVAKFNSGSLRILIGLTVLIATLLGLYRVFFDDDLYERADWRSLGAHLEAEVDTDRDLVATLNFQDLIPLHFYYRGDSSIHPLIQATEVRRAELSPPSDEVPSAHLWLILPHLNRSEHLVGNCQPIDDSSFPTFAELREWRQEISERLVDTIEFACIRVEKYDW